MLYFTFCIIVSKFNPPHSYSSTYFNSEELPPGVVWSIFPPEITFKESGSHFFLRPLEVGFFGDNMLHVFDHFDFLGNVAGNNKGLA